MTIEDPHSAEDLLTYQPVVPPVRLVGDPDDPLTSEDVASLDGQEAQDVAYDREHAADAALDSFMAGVRDSDHRWNGPRYSTDLAYAQGHDFGMVLQDALAVDPELAPLWDALVK